MTPAVYLRTNPARSLFYVGVTTNLWRRNQDYLLAINPISHVNRHGLTQLVHVEYFQSITDAIVREKLLKKMPRSRKLKLISAFNPDWHDLTPEIWQEN